MSWSRLPLPRRPPLLRAVAIACAALAFSQVHGFELCDGRDNDGDGVVDPGCPSTCIDARTDGEGLTLSPTDARTALGHDRALAWDGRRFAAVWVEEDGWDTWVTFARRGPSGRPLGDPVRLTDAGPLDADAVIAAGPSGYGVAWSQEDFGLPQILFAHVDRDGTLDAGPVVVGIDGDEGQRPAIAWDGEAFAVAWAWYNSRVHLQRLDASGVALADPVCLNCSDDSGAGAVSIAPGPGRLAVAYDDARGTLKLVQTDASGQPDAGPVTLASATAQRPSVTWADGEWAVAWYDRRGGEDGVYLNRVDTSGQVQGTDVAATSGESYAWDPSIAWTGAELLVGWAGADGAFHGLFLRRFDGEGQPLAPALRLPGGEMPYPRCSLAWTGSRPALLRDTDELETPRPAVLHLARCCPDADGDSASRCEGDRDDLDDGVAPGAEELCDGRDNDLDGTLDEGCDGSCSAAPWHDDGWLGDHAEAGTSVAARGAGAAPGACVPRSAPTGGGAHLELLRGGPPWTADPLESDDGPSLAAAAARMGGTCAVAWSDTRAGGTGLRYGARNADDGAVVALDVDLGVGGGAARPSLARTGTGAGLAWVGGPDDPRAHWSLLDPGGARLLEGEPLGSGSGPGAAAADLAPRLDAPGVALAWLEPGPEGIAVRLELRDLHGGREAGPVEIAAAAPGRTGPAVTATSSGYLVAWSQPPAPGALPEIFTRAVGHDLAPTGPTSQLTLAGGGADAPALTFTGSEVVAVFRDARDGEPRPFRARLSTGGSRLGPDTPLGTDRDVGPPAAAWDGERLRTIWTVPAAGGYELRAGRLACTASPSAPPVRGLRVAADRETLSWDPVEEALYDVISGRLDVLLTEGSFTPAVDQCEVSNHDGTEWTVPERSLPCFYLVRAVVGGAPGTYASDGLLPTAGRDDEIAASPDACP